jgi:hypothetical protein
MENQVVPGSGEFVPVVELANILEFAERDEEVPHARMYQVSIDGEKVIVDTPYPTGNLLLSKVGKQPCAFELIEEFAHHENCVVEPDEAVNLRKPSLKGFLTAHKEIVTISINNDPYQIERGERTVAEILSKADKTPEGYILLEEKNGPPMPLPPNLPVTIRGCEIFHTQVQSGGSSQ